MIYSYRCPKGHETDQEFPMGHSAPTIDCPVCGKPTAKELHPLRFRLTGEGWAGKSRL